MLEACLESGVCKGFTIWGFSDKDSVWETQKDIDGYSPKADPLLYDDNFSPKPAYFAVLEVLRRFAQQNPTLTPTVKP
jgi:endo-1,4-beta-xylanase